jgi:hypothetical protein
VESLHFWRTANWSSFVYLQSSSLCFSLRHPCHLRRPCARAPAAPRHPSSSHVPSQHSARRSQPCAGPLPTPPRHAAVARAATRAAELASSCSTCAVLLLALKLAQVSLSTSFTHSTAPHYLSFLPPLEYSRRSSAAASARRRQPPLPPPTLDPVLQQHPRHPLMLTGRPNSALPH